MQALHAHREIVCSKSVCGQFPRPETGRLDHWTETYDYFDQQQEKRFEGKLAFIA
jgi:hypothetical protein